jgi:hypothetical protein
MQAQIICCIALIERQDKNPVPYSPMHHPKGLLHFCIFKNPLNPSIVVVPASVSTERA